MPHETTTIVSDTLEQLAYSVYNLMVMSSLDMLTEEENELVDQMLVALYEFDPQWAAETGADVYLEVDDLMEDSDDD